MISKVLQSGKKFAANTQVPRARSYHFTKHPRSHLYSSVPSSIHSSVSGLVHFKAWSLLMLNAILFYGPTQFIRSTCQGTWGLSPASGWYAWYGAHLWPVFVRTYVSMSPGPIIRNKISGVHGKYIFNFLRDGQTFFQSVHFFFHLPSAIYAGSNVTVSH